MPPIDRSVQLKVLLSTEERETLQELADDAGLSVSDYLRQLIRRERDAKRASKKR
jgi:Ribbon-helix-helix protein, copG family